MSSRRSQTRFQRAREQAAAALKQAANQIRETVSGKSEEPRPLTFKEFVKLVKPSYQWFRHCDVLAEVLQKVADGELKRVMIFMPPRHGKSELASRLFPAYFLYRYPEKFVGLASYSQGLANTFSRAAKANYLAALAALGEGKVVPLNKAARAVKQWETESGGGFWGTGVGGEATGKGLHLGIIDDPLKNALQAASEVVREGQKEWYGSTWFTREQMQFEGAESFEAAFVYVMTRWHEDDLCGWLLSKEKAAAADPDADETLENWHIVNLPAVAEDESQAFPSSCTIEADWREPGEALCPEARPLRKLKRIFASVGEYVWNALFQQRPRAKDGTAFKRAWFTDNLVDAAPLQAQYVRFWDKAGSGKKSACYTAGVLMCRCLKTGYFYVVDVVRFQEDTGERERRMRETAIEDARKYGSVEIWMEQEPGSGGLDSARASVLNLSGFNARYETATGDKQLRFEPFAAQAKVGNVKFVKGDWNLSYVEELCSLWSGKYKDQADATGGSFNKLALVPVAEAPLSGGEASTLSTWKGTAAAAQYQPDEATILPPPPANPVSQKTSSAMKKLFGA